MDARVISAFTRVHSPSKTGVNALNDAPCPRMTWPEVDVTLPRLRGGAVDRRRGLAEQDRALLRGADAAHVRVDRLRLLVGALDRRPRARRLEPALEVREIGDVLALAL